MAQVDLEDLGGSTYRVVITEGGSSSTHEVTVDRQALGPMVGDFEERALVAASFRFLLDREPKEAILNRFDLSVIARYFSDYPSRIVDYL